MALLFHAADLLLGLGIVTLMCVAVIALFNTLARRLDEKSRERHKPPSRGFGRRKSGR
jgi:hypothetical protein